MSGAAPRVAVVTGAASGIGLACARALAARGWRVFGTTRRETACTGEAVESFRWLRMDVDSDESVNGAVREVLETAERIDLVVNAAGFGLAGAVEDTGVAEATGGEVTRAVFSSTELVCEREAW